MSKLVEMDQDIMRLWSTTDDLDLLLDAVCNQTMTTDDIANTVLGIRMMLDLRCERVYNSYEQALKEHYDHSKA